MGNYNNIIIRIGVGNYNSIMILLYNNIIIRIGVAYVFALAETAVFSADEIHHLYHLGCVFGTGVRE